jgi:uncharacterized protein YqgC (DUF456 family)
MGAGVQVRGELSMSVVLIVLGGLCVIAGLVGCILPIIPGPPISYISLILLSLAYSWHAFSAAFLIVTGVITVIVTVADFILPVYLPKRYGASKFGVWGSILGMIAGMVFFPPFGLIIGTLAGAILGELIFSRNRRGSLKAALGVFVGTVAAIFLKVSVSGIIGFYFFKAVIRGPLA